MGGRHLFHVFLPLLLFLVACAPESPSRGVLVTEVEPWGAAHEAGLRAGDILMTWSRGEDGGAIHSPLDVELLMMDQTPRGPVEIGFWREGREGRATLRHSDWAVETAVLEGDRSPPSERWRRLESARNADASRDTAEVLRRVDEARAGWTDPRLADVALSLEMRTLSERRGSDLELARSICEETVERLRARDPSSPLLGWYLDALGMAYFRLVDERAGEAYREALSIYRALPNSHVERSLVSNHLANLALRGGDYAVAERLYRDAVELRREVTPRAPRLGALLSNSGLALRRQGHLNEAERTLLEALRVSSIFRPRGIGAAYALRNLGLLALDKGNHEAAEGYYERALDIFSEMRPGNFEVAGMELNLGNIAKRRGRLSDAERRYRRALALWDELDYDAVHVASGLHNLGDVLLEQGRLSAARSILEQALAAKVRHVPRSPIVATTLYSLGRLHYRKGELDLAEALHDRALAIRQAVIPDTADTAESLFALARIAEDRGHRQLARDRRRAGVDILESQRDRLAFGSEERSRFSARFHEEYRALAEFQVDAGRAREAFEFLESSRARSLRALMSQREVHREDLRELTAERWRWEQRLSRVRSRLARTAVGDDEAFRAAERDLREIHTRLDDLREEMETAEAGGTFGSEPGRISLASVRRKLGLGTKLVSYSVGPDRLLVFVVSPEGSKDAGIRVHEVQLARTHIAALVERLRAFIERGRERRVVETALLRIAHELYQALWRPLEQDLRETSRVAIVAEGPLLGLPFGALVRDVDRRGFLAEEVALSFSSSAALVGASSSSSAPAPRELVAFGDPKTASAPAPLPYAQKEVEALAALFPGGVSLFLGDGATEAALKREAPGALYLHLAAHAELDERFPLSSSVLLASDATEDGRLHAWEVVEELRLQAELVVLSGCDTGRGRELSGEGALGLARAFRAAGAQAVLASLWQVADHSTSELMVRFHEQLDGGSEIDVALARAQRWLLASDAWGHPYHWASFRLMGNVSREPAIQDASRSSSSARP